MTVLEIILVILALAAAIGAGVNYYLWQKMKKNLAALFVETGHAQFGEVLLYHQKQHKAAQENLQQIYLRLGELEDQSQLLLNQVGLVRYNPFPNSGGNMSFSLALLNAHGDGAIITSLHSRDGTRFYSKTVRKYESEQVLTEEERQAVERAKRAKE